MIDLGFLAGYALGCICTAALFLIAMRPTIRRIMAPDLDAAAHSEVASLAVSAGQFVSSVRSLKRQIDTAHDALLRGIR